MKEFIDPETKDSVIVEVLIKSPLEKHISTVITDTKGVKKNTSEVFKMSITPKGEIETESTKTDASGQVKVIKEVLS